jgi:very-short-patch-repair endonuclease
VDKPDSSAESPLPIPSRSSSTSRRSWRRRRSKTAVNEADRLDLIRTHRLRPALDREPSRPGVGRLKRILDAQTFSRAANALERRFLAIVREAGIPAPETQRRLGRNRVDFFWPALGFVVETDSLRHHRTAAERAVDLGRDQAHAREGLRSLRFTHSQVFHRPDHVREVLVDAFRHLSEPGT